MSSSVSLEASVSPTPPSHKMNGGLPHRSDLNVGSLGASKYSLGTGTFDAGPPHDGSCRPLLDLSVAGLYPPRWTGGRPGSGGRPESEEEEERGVYRTLASLALLCLLSLPLSFLALFFLQRAGPAPSPDGEEATVSGRDGATVHQVSVALGTLTVCLDLCCLFVCCLQFLFALKLLQTPRGVDRTDRFLKRSSHTRLLAIGGFFLSIPLFFTGIILFGFVHFQELPAAVTGAAVGAGIVFCGVASVHDVYLWQGHKTDASRALIESRLSRIREASLPPDSGPHVAELSTLV
ncbi:uncharacterized protein LOC111635391 [Centruroides sculpturatus]|uniref:uncharacterized protein LOC111635391 n=1 Tax=Centruroides sculpturatus TaxID=218467 RepID=UPI000C6D51BB|nr:uncharacterized protein LOC111635391 [Centruroides sculpturatus]XP_023236114.1 uncharacterized protein LOC111635391 [Centruroides sculpturatus]